MEQVVLQAGMKVKIKNSPKNFGHNARKVKTITKVLDDFNKVRAFELNNDSTGIWLIDDFEYCLEHKTKQMI